MFVEWISAQSFADGYQYESKIERDVDIYKLTVQMYRFDSTLHGIWNEPRDQAIVNKEEMEGEKWIIT